MKNEPLAREGKKAFLPEHMNAARMAPLYILVGMIVVLSVMNGEFLKMATFKNLFHSVAAVGIVAIGAMMVIITGGIDFTTGYGVAVAGVSAGVLYIQSDFNLAVLIITGIAVGVAVGMINGLIITKLKVPPFIATLAMMSVLQGLSLLISQGKRLLIDDPAALFIGQGELFGVVPVSFIVFILICIVGYILLWRTKFGIYVFTMGGNEEAAVYAGVNVKKYKLLVYVFAGFCVGVASVVTMSRVALITPNISGSILMDAIASAIIGGTSVSGGKGTILGTVLGVLIMGLISTLMTYLNVDTLLRDVVKGGIIIVALFFDSFANKAAQRA